MGENKKKISNIEKKFENWSKAILFWNWVQTKTLCDKKGKYEGFVTCKYSTLPITPTECYTYSVCDNTENIFYSLTIKASGNTCPSFLLVSAAVGGYHSQCAL